MKDKKKNSITRWLETLHRWVLALDHDPILDLHQRIERLESRRDEDRSAS